MGKSGKWCYYRRPTTQDGVSQGVSHNFECTVHLNEGHLCICPFKNVTDAEICVDFERPETFLSKPYRSCPHCGNTAGFVCNTCIVCGFNSEVKAFDWIRVDVEDLGTGGPHYLVKKHADATRRHQGNV